MDSSALAYYVLFSHLRFVIPLSAAPFKRLKNETAETVISS